MFKLNDIEVYKSNGLSKEAKNRVINDIEVYTYNELSEEAKNRVKKDIWNNGAENLQCAMADDDYYEMSFDNTWEEVYKGISPTVYELLPYFKYENNKILWATCGLACGESNILYFLPYKDCNYLCDKYHIPNKCIDGRIDIHYTSYSRHVVIDITNTSSDLNNIDQIIEEYMEIANSNIEIKESLHNINEALVKDIEIALDSRVDNEISNLVDYKPANTLDDFITLNSDLSFYGLELFDKTGKKYYYHVDTKKLSD